LSVIRISAMIGLIIAIVAAIRHRVGPVINLVVVVVILVTTRGVYRDSPDPAGDAAPSGIDPASHIRQSTQIAVTSNAAATGNHPEAGQLTG